MIFTIIGIVGAIYVSKDKSLYANCLFAIANAGLLVYNYKIKEYEMMMLFIVYEAIAIYGIYNLKFKKVDKWMN